MVLLTEMWVFISYLLAISEWATKGQVPSWQKLVHGQTILWKTRQDFVQEKHPMLNTWWTFPINGSAGGPGGSLDFFLMNRLNILFLFCYFSGFKMEYLEYKPGRNTDQEEDEENPQRHHFKQGTSSQRNYLYLTAWYQGFMLFTYITLDSFCSERSNKSSKYDPHSKVRSSGPSTLKYTRW